MKNKWILPIILVFAFIFRVVGLTSHPIGFTPDEASFGYDAYSILKTGKDQWGNFMPLVLKSFGDYKAPLLAYLTIPFVAIFDLTKFAVRLPNALLGAAAVYVVYLFTSELFKKNNVSNRISIPLVATLLVAISPWHIMMSRGAFEANLTTFFLPLGLYFFLKKNYSLSAFVFGLNLFTYHSAKLITPIVILLLVLLMYKELKDYGIKKLISPILIIGLFGIMTLYTFTQGAGARVKDINIFSGSIEEGSVQKNLAVSSGEMYTLAKIFHNKFTISASRFFNNYTSYFSPQFLLTKGPAETTYGMIPGIGVLTLIEFIGFLIGLVVVLSMNFLDARQRILLISWLMISVVPASLATGPGYAGNRAVAMIPVIQIISAIGIYKLVQFKETSKYIVGGLMVFGLIVFFEKYIYLSPSKLASGMLYGNLEAADYVSENYKDYQNIVVSKSISEPHIYVAFATKYNPTEFQEVTKNWRFEDKNLKWVDQLDEYKLGSFIFKRYNWRDGIENNNLIVGRPDEFLPETETLLKIYYPNGEPSIYVKNK